jgi:hypothetical protein
MLEVILFSLFVGIAVYMVVTRKKDDPRLPPGPKGYPIFGNILDIDMTCMQVKFLEWVKEFGDIFSIKLFGTRAIILSSSEMIRDAMLTKPFDVIFSDRAPSFVGKYVFGLDDITLSSYDKQWQARRNVVHRILKLHGEGGMKTQQMVIRELRRGVDQIRQTNGQAFDPQTIVLPVLADIMNCLVSRTSSTL